ncbi:restriction endonuclease subunit S, partial [Haemophilus influenzae]
FNRTRMQIEEYRAKFAKIFNELEIVRGGVKRFKINELQLLLKRGKSPKYGNSSIQVIKSGQARGYNEFLFNERFFLADNFIIDERKLQKGDILINSTGEGTAGRVTLFGLDGDFVVDSHITIFRPNEKVLPKFAMYSLAHIGFKTIERMATGASGQIELNLSTIGNISFLVPDLNEQQSIVNQINEIETQISELEKVLENSRQEKKAVLDKWL